MIPRGFRPRLADTCPSKPSLITVPGRRRARVPCQEGMMPSKRRRCTFHHDIQHIVMVLSTCVAGLVFSPHMVAAEDRLRITSDLCRVDGPQWYPTPSEETGDPVVIEVAIQLATSLTLGDPHIALFGIGDAYEVVPSQKVAGSCSDNLARALDAKYYLRSTAAPSGSGTFIVKTWLDDVRSLKVTRAEQEAEALPEDLSSAFATSVIALLRSTGVGFTGGEERSKDLLVEFKRYPFEYHVELAKCRLYRSLGRRFGDPDEGRLVRQADASRRRAVEIRSRAGLTSPAGGEVLEELALLWRSYNLSRGEDDRFFGSISNHDELVRERGHAFPELYMWQGIARSRRPNLGDARESFDLAISLSREGLADAYLNRALTKNSDHPEQDYRTAIELNPALLRARVYLAVELASEQRWEESQRQFQELLKIREYPLALYEQAKLLWRDTDSPGGGVRREELDRALEIIDRLLNLGGFYMEDAQVLRGLILAEKQEWELAERALVESLKGREYWSEFAPSYLVALDARTAKDPQTARIKFGELLKRLEQNLARSEGDTTTLEYSMLGLIATRAGIDRMGAEIAAGVGALLTRKIETPDETRAYLALICTRAALGQTDVAQVMTELRQLAVN